jgi:thiol-disulfide isomerase/thioredoxin
VRRALASLLASILVVAGAACDGAAPAPPDTVAAPFADCAGLTTSPPSQSARPSAQGGAQPVDMPAVELDCFVGGDRVRLDSLRGPAVVNLWASWCPPCVKELPAFQRFADTNAGRVHVIGVVTSDERDAAAAMADDLGVRFPALFDGGDELRRALARTALPITLFVDADGRVRHLYMDEALDDASLADLAARHLGVGQG